MPWGRRPPDKPKEMRLTLDSLWGLTPLTPETPEVNSGSGVKAGVTECSVNAGVKDGVTRAARSLLFDAVKAQAHIQSAFYPEEVHTTQACRHVDMGQFPVAELATALYAQAIARHKDAYGFHDTVDRGAVEDKLRDIYTSLQWKKLGFRLYTLLYPDVVRDPDTHVRLRDYMGEDGHLWAEQLVARLSEPSWTRATQQRLYKGQLTDDTYNQEMNGLFLKLHLLDPQSVIPAYQCLLNQRALPAVNLELATRNYLGGPLDPAILDHVVQEAEGRETTPVHAQRRSLHAEDLVDVTYGDQVEHFIMTHCRTDDLWSGARPDNCRQVKAKDKCVVM